MSREAKLREEWHLVAIDYVGTRIVYIFGSLLDPNIVEVRISVSGTFANPENQAWKLLSDTVK